MTNNTIPESFPKSRTFNLTTQEIGDEILIYDLEINRAFSLNQTAALVWQYSDGHNSVHAIAAKLSETLRRLVSEQMIWLALDQLNKENLLLAESVSALSSKGISRRKLLREAALTSAVALPVISAIAAPEAVQAQSNNCVPFGSFGCLTAQDCCPPPQGVSQVVCDLRTPMGGRGQCLEFFSTV
jgi:hypothetical protein